MTQQEALVIAQARWGSIGHALECEGRWGEPSFSFGTKDGTRWGLSSESFEDAIKICDSTPARSFKSPFK